MKFWLRIRPSHSEEYFITEAWIVILQLSLKKWDIEQREAHNYADDHGGDGGGGGGDDKDWKYHHIRLKN
jgi:hypothetical protein